MAGVVREDGVELALADRHFIKAQMRPHVLWKDEPLSSMGARFPRGEVAEMFAVLPHKSLGIQARGLGNRGQCQWLVVSLVLLKKRQIPSPVGSQGP